MNGIKRKLKSEKGASLILALLLFLVCAVVGSVVLVAATTSAGRMSEMPKMDRRYYSVVSAAEVVRKVFDGKVVEARAIESGTAEYLNDDGEWTEVPDLSSTVTDYLTKESLYILKEELGLDNSWEPLAGEDAVANYELTAWEGEEELSSLKAKVEIKRLDNSSPYRGLTITLSNNNEDDTEHYTLTMAYKADILEEQYYEDDKLVKQYTVSWTAFEVGR